MFTNSGKKIKKFVKILFIIGVILNAIGFVALLYIAIEEGEEYFFLFPFLALPLGMLIYWVSLLCLYGYGELIENSSIIARNISTGPDLEKDVVKENLDDEPNALKNKKNTDEKASTEAVKSEDACNSDEMKENKDFDSDDSILPMQFANKDMVIVNIENNIRSIGEKAFFGCKSLARVYIPKSVNYIGSGAFSEDNIFLVIYCEFESQPDTWDKNWNAGNYKVVWDYKK